MTLADASIEGDDLHMWYADGQWCTAGGTIDHENSKVLLLVHPDTAVARDLVQSVIERYRITFEQESRAVGDCARLRGVLRSERR